MSQPARAECVNVAPTSAPECIPPDDTNWASAGDTCAIRLSRPTESSFLGWLLLCRAECEQASAVWLLRIGVPAVFRDIGNSAVVEIPAVTRLVPDWQRRH